MTLHKSYFPLAIQYCEDKSNNIIVVNSPDDITSGKSYKVISTNVVDSSKLTKESGRADFTRIKRREVHKSMAVYIPSTRNPSIVDQIISNINAHTKDSYTANSTWSIY